MLRLRVPGEPWTSCPCAHGDLCNSSWVSWPAVYGPIRECQLSSCAGLGSQGTQGIVLMQLCSRLQQCQCHAATPLVGAACGVAEACDADSPCALQ